jgi:hypothetical protein
VDGSDHVAGRGKRAQRGRGSGCMPFSQHQYS